MKRHIDSLKRKPEHIRHRVAMGTAAAITGLVAVVWLVSHAASGTFALSSPSQLAGEDNATDFADTRTNFSDLVGAVGESLGATSTEPELTIVDGNTTSTITPPPASGNNTDATAIPF